MRADRLLSILMLLQARGHMTAEQLAEETEVSVRTIYRDIDALSAAGVPVYAERGPGGGCALVEGYRTSLTGLTENEVRALFMLSVPSSLDDASRDASDETDTPVTGPPSGHSTKRSDRSGTSQTIRNPSFSPSRQRPPPEARMLLSADKARQATHPGWPRRLSW